MDGSHLVAKSLREKINCGGERRERYDNKSRGREGYFDDISSSPFQRALRAESDATSPRIIATSSSSVDRRGRKRREEGKAREEGILWKGDLRRFLV